MEQLEAPSPKRYFQQELTSSFQSFGDDVEKPRTLHVIEYISETFSNFLPYFSAPEIWRKQGSITFEIAKLHPDYRNLGDACLWLVGMFPESTNVHKLSGYFTDIGMYCYDRLDRHSDSKLGLFGDLSHNFPGYTERINHARNKMLRRAPPRMQTIRLLGPGYISSKVH